MYKCRKIKGLGIALESGGAALNIASAERSKLIKHFLFFGYTDQVIITVKLKARRYGVIKTLQLGCQIKPRIYQ